MTRDGFTFLAMGFTGARAAAWKEKYIAAFNAMEETLVKGSNVLEKNLVVLTELQQQMKDSVSNGFGMINMRMETVETLVELALKKLICRYLNSPSMRCFAAWSMRMQLSNKSLQRLFSRT